MLKEQGKNLSVLHFHAAWASQCGQMNDVLKELSKQHPDVSLFGVCTDVNDFLYVYYSSFSSSGTFKIVVSNT